MKTENLFAHITHVGNEYFDNTKIYKRLFNKFYKYYHLIKLVKYEKWKTAGLIT